MIQVTTERPGHGGQVFRAAPRGDVTGEPVSILSVSESWNLLASVAFETHQALVARFDVVTEPDATDAVGLTGIDAKVAELRAAFARMLAAGPSAAIVGRVGRLPGPPCRQLSQRDGGHRRSSWSAC